MHSLLAWWVGAIADSTGTSAKVTTTCQMVLTTARMPTKRTVSTGTLEGHGELQRHFQGRGWVAHRQLSCKLVNNDMQRLVLTLTHGGPLTAGAGSDNWRHVLTLVISLYCSHPLTAPYRTQASEHAVQQLLWVSLACA